MSNYYRVPVIISIVVLFFFPITSFACDDTAQSVLEKEKTELFDLKHADLPKELYNFRKQHCVSVGKIPNDVEVTAYFPNDETTLGMYQLFREKGDDQLTALKHTLAFNIASNY